MMLAILLLSFIPAAVLGAHTTTHHGHNHRSTVAPVGETTSFLYDAPSNFLMMKKGSHCYLLAADADEQTTVHTTDGMRAMEAKAYAYLTNGYHVGITGQDIMAISRPGFHFCGTQTLAILKGD